MKSYKKYVYSRSNLIILFSVLMFFSILILTACSDAVFASQPLELTLDEIVITGDPILDTISNNSIGKKIIEQGKNINVADVLKLGAEVDIKRTAAAGDTGDIISIRGLSRNRIMLNVNGRPLTASGIVGGYYIDWSGIPLDDIEKIEIIKGGSSALYGNNAIGGAVNIITRKPKSGRPKTTLYAMGAKNEADGANDNFKIGHSGKNGRLGYSLAVSRRKSPEFLWNNDFTGKNGSIFLYYDMPRGAKLSFGGQYSNTRRGFIRNNRRSLDCDNPLFNSKINEDYPLSLGETISGSGINNIANIGPGAYWDKDKYLYDLTYNQPFRNGYFEIKHYRNKEDRKEKNFSTADGHLVLDRVVESDRSFGSSVQVVKIDGRNETTFGAERKIIANGDITVNFVDNVYNGRIYTGTTPNNEGLNQNFYIQNVSRINDRLSVTAGLRRYDYIIGSLTPSTRELSGSGAVPKFSAQYDFSGGQSVSVSAYHAERTPGLPEIYWAQNAVKVAGNARIPVALPELKTERNKAAEISYCKNFNKTDNLRATAYSYKISDYIMSRFETNWSGIYNIDSVGINGFSLEANKAFGPLSSLNANATWQKSSKAGDLFDTDNLLNGLDSMPKFKLNLSYERKLKNFRGSVLALGARYVGKQDQIYTFGKNVNRLVKVDSFTIFDAGIKIPLERGYQAEIFVDNVFNKKYEEKFGYPLMGRTIGASMKVDF